MSNPVPELQNLLGPGVVFVNWPKGSKGTKRKWAHLTVANMTPEHLAILPLGNIGVALGKVSRDLCVIDLDNDALVEPFLTLNPQLEKTLQTHGSRGQVFWLRCKGQYPQRTIKLKTHTGKDVGEIRSNGSQSIVWGIHPGTNKPYQFVVKQPVVEIEFNSIHWPAQIKNPLRANIQNSASDTEWTELHKSSVSLCGSVSPSPLSALSLCITVKSIEHAVELALPSKNHQNNERLFTLARAVKNLEKRKGEFSPIQLREVFNQWFKRAADFLRPEQTRDEYMAEFMNAYASAKIPLGEGIIVEAWTHAQEKPLPPEAVEIFEDHKMRLVVALCRELQIIARKEPFYLSARTVQGLLKQDGHATAARWLRSFCVLKIIKVVEQGDAKRATRYHYLYPIST